MEGALLKGRYLVGERLGEGMTATTYVGTDQSNGAPIVIKHLVLRGLREWKLLELFEREGKALAELDHPAIPAYIDAFTEGGEAEPSFFLVQQRAPGLTLSRLLDQGWRATNDEIRDIATQALRALAYLHGRMPAIIHRDIKPANMVRGPDAKVFLVDFGSVTDLQRDATGTSHTLVGTVGYMAPEQLAGHVHPASDLYSLGHTLIHCATGKNPRELPWKHGVVVFRGHSRLAPDLARFIDRLIAANVEDRFESAERALAMLRGERAPRSRWLLPVAAGGQRARSRGCCYGLPNRPQNRQAAETAAATRQATVGISIPCAGVRGQDGRHTG